MDTSKPTLILHFSLLSSETELFEDFFSLNYDQLISLGVMYPTTLGSNYKQNISHEEFIEHLLKAHHHNDDEDLNNAINELTVKVANSNSHLVYLSSDSLIQLTESELAHLVHALEGHFSISALLFLRNHYSYLEELYKQHTLDGVVMDMPDFIDKYKIDYFSKIMALAKLINQDDISLKIFDVIKSPNEYVREVFPDIENADIRELIKNYMPSYYSAELSSEETLLIQALNQQTQSKYSNEIRRFFKRYKKVSFQIPSTTSLFSENDIAQIKQGSLTNDEKLKHAFFEERPSLFKDVIAKYQVTTETKPKWSNSSLQLILHSILNGPKNDHVGVFCPQIHGKKNIQVQLCAIAKDEGAYLAEWIFHHLHFGFDEIKILINDTSDDSVEIINRINSIYPSVTFENIDHLISSMQDEGDNNDFQVRAYQHAYKQVAKDPNQYLMFLDIDEFWTPIDFTSSIKDFLFSLELPDLVSFEWALKFNESLFGAPFNNELELVKELGVKSIFKTCNTVQRIDIHNSVIRSVDNILASGARHPRQYFGLVDTKNQAMPLKTAFILHRVWRSEVEYIAHSFKKSNTNLYYSQVADGVSMKTNRKGYEYSDFKQKVYFEISNDALEPYKHDFNNFVSQTDVALLIKESREQVLNRFVHGHRFLNSHKNKDNIQFREFTINLSLPYALRSAREYLENGIQESKRIKNDSNEINDVEYITRTDFTFYHTTNPKHIFIHIMKNGGTSLAKSLGFTNKINRNLVGCKKHHTVQEVIDIIGEDKWADSFSFAFVRNPWARMLSLYRYLERKNELQSRKMKDMINPSFNQWVNQLINEKNGPYQWTQHDWLVDNHGKLSLNFIGRFESLNADYKTLCKAIGINSPLMQINMSKKNSNEYRAHYSDETAELVAQHFKADIDLFKYQF